MLKKELIDAGRYEDILKVLNDIINSNLSIYPVRPFVDVDFKVKTQVNYYFVKNEAKKLLNVIEKNEENDPCEFNNLLQVVNTKRHTLCNNYVVSLSHKKFPKIELEEIRIWMTLENLIDNLYDDKWNVPEGWRK